MEINKIYNEDCLIGIKKIKDKSIDVSFTSPPYNRVRNDTYDYYDDTLEDYFGLLDKATKEMLRVTKGYCIINVQQNMCNKSEIFRWLGKYANKINGVYVWAKNNPQPANNYREFDNTRSVTNCFEYFFFFKDGKDFRSYGKHQTKNHIITNVNSEHFKGHGAVMRYDVAEYFIKKFTKENDIVLDMFMGCGTTALACINNKRNYIGFEIAEEYLKICNNRISIIQPKLF